MHVISACILCEQVLSAGERVSYETPADGGYDDIAMTVQQTTAVSFGASSCGSELRVALSEIPGN